LAGQDSLNGIVPSSGFTTFPKQHVPVTNNEADFRDYPDLRVENWI
jgi:hypothetical protein